MHCHLRCLVVTSLLSLVSAAHALDRLPEGSEFEIFVENDMLANTDRYYTNGLKFGVGLPLDLIQVPASDLLRKLADGEEAPHVGLFLGQNMYTPRQITIATPQPWDRPWAAWLYLGGVAQLARGNRLDTVELDLGLVGPPALGRQIQTEWHRLIGVATPQGWSNQITSEPAFMVTYLQKRKFGWGAVELIPHAGASLGTVMTLARAGATVRVGQNMTGFGPDTIEPGGAMLRDMRRKSEPGRARAFEWSIHAGIDQRLVAYNVFLDGNVFHHSPSVKRQPHVFDLTAGFSVRWQAVRFSFTRVRRSEEFYTESHNGGRQNFDSLNLGIEF
jgi:hypothetical protein